MPKYSRKFSALACAIATAIIGIDFSLYVKPAHASVVDLSCAGGYSNHYNPGLTLQEKQTTITYDVTLTCNPLIANTAIISGRSGATYTYSVSCNSVLQGSTDATYYWSDGQYSKIHAVFSDEKPVGDGVTTATGLVTEGEFKNDTVIITITTATLDSAKCATTGVTSATGAETITLVRP